MVVAVVVAVVGTGVVLPSWRGLHLRLRVLKPRGCVCRCACKIKKDFKLDYTGYGTCFGWDPQHQVCWYPIATTHLGSRLCAMAKKKSLGWRLNLRFTAPLGNGCVVVLGDGCVVACIPRGCSRCSVTVHG